MMSAPLGVNMDADTKFTVDEKVDVLVQGVSI